MVIEEQTCNSGDSRSIPERIDDIEIRERMARRAVSVSRVLCSA